MRRLLVLAEGVEDRSAIRELITRRSGFRREHRPGSPSKEELYRREEVSLSILKVEGKNDIITALIDQLQRVHADLDTSWAGIGLVFDLDWESISNWRARINSALQKAGFPVTADSMGFRVESCQVVLLPWDLDVPFNRLEPKWHSLERVGIGVLQSQAAEAAVVDRMLEVVEAAVAAGHLPQERKPNWKTAWVLWNALRCPQVRPETGFADRVFGQDSELRPALEHVLGDFLRRLDTLLSPS